MEKRTIIEDDEMEIDLIQLFLELKKRIWLILAAAVLFGGGAGAYSRFVITPQYQSSAKVYILSKETTLTSLADLQIGSQLTQDYKVIVTSRPVLEDVIRQLNLNMTYQQLDGKLTIGNPKDTRILTMTVEDPDPEMAKKIVNAVALTSSQYIGDIMEMVPPKIIEEGVTATHKSSPSNSKNALMGALFGAVLVCGLVVLEVLMNDTVQSEEDVEKYLGLSVLASVPEREGDSSEDKEKLAKNRSSRKKDKKNKRKRGGKR